MNIKYIVKLNWYIFGYSREFKLKKKHKKFHTFSNPFPIKLCFVNEKKILYYCMTTLVLVTATISLTGLAVMTQKSRTTTVVKFTSWLRNWKVSIRSRTLYSTASFKIPYICFTITAIKFNSYSYAQSPVWIVSRGLE